jgi:hypothetical protein
MELHGTPQKPPADKRCFFFMYGFWRISTQFFREKLDVALTRDYFVRQRSTASASYRRRAEIVADIRTAD